MRISPIFFILSLIISSNAPLYANEETITLVCQPVSGVKSSGEQLDLRDGIAMTLEITFYATPDASGTPATIAQTGEIRQVYMGRISTAEVTGTTAILTELDNYSNKNYEVTIEVNRYTGQYRQKFLNKLNDAVTVIMGDCRSAERKF